jgi:phage recombination protein Bet
MQTEDANKLSAQLARRSIDDSTWNTLKNSIFPGALNASILMAVDYCLARKLDILKKPCHIVPMNVKDAKSGEYAFRDVILPGIYEYRTTAMRTGLYLGHTEPVYGPEQAFDETTAPVTCSMTVYRWNVLAAMKVPFPVTVKFREVVGLTKDGKINARWDKAPVQMLTKCTEAAALREAFPEELGGEPTMEEMTGATVVAEQQVVQGSRTAAAAEALRKAQATVSTQQQQKALPSIESAVGQLRATMNLADLEREFAAIRENYGNRELPLDIEAHYMDRKESFQGETV